VEKKNATEPTKRLLDYYTVGEMLGQGTFGVVYACKPKGQDRECAVKMVDKVETPVDKIKEEADFLRKMNHPNVIRCYDVIYEKCFVCIVMDRLKGGDLILGMQAHWKTTGRIPFAVSSRICSQMGASLHYLHGQWMAHRDIKGDNYLTDRKDITDPNCRVVLTDFGTGLSITPGQRLHEKCGTKLYWSPEFFRMDYTLKVDTWAMGVVVYGLLCGRFPFRNEVEANKKALSFAPDVPADAQDLAQRMLAKVEDQRATSDIVVNHSFILWRGGDAAQEKPPAPKIVVEEPKEDKKPAAGYGATSPAQAGTETAVESQTTGPEKEAIMKENGANHGVVDRRYELVERLMHAGEKRNSRVVTPAFSTYVKFKESHSEIGEDEPGYHWDDTFTIVDKRANLSEIQYCWWTPDRVRDDVQGIHEAHGVTNLDGAKPVNEDHAGEEKASTKFIEYQLQEHGIDTSAFGKGEAKTLQQLAAEVQSGAAVLMLDATEHKKLVRVVDVVALRIMAPGDTDKFLIETSETFSDGRTRATGRLPGTKKDCHENTKDVAERIVAEMLDLKGSNVVFDFSLQEEFEEEMKSPSYPGVTTVYRKLIVEGTLIAAAVIDSGAERRPSAATCFESSQEFSKKDATGNTKFFHWMSPKDCEEKNIQYKKPVDDDDHSCLVQAPIGLSEDDLTTYLKAYMVDVNQFGTGKAKTLEEFSHELMKGDSSLNHAADGTIIRIVDVVLLKLTNDETGKVLVQTIQTYKDGSEVTLNRLPGAKRRPDENQFLTARTIVQRYLRIDDNHVTCNAKDVVSFEEEKTSLAYPGLRTVYRKRIVNARLALKRPVNRRTTA